MNEGSLADRPSIPTWANMLNKSIFLTSNTNIGQDGKNPQLLQFKASRYTYGRRRAKTDHSVNSGRGPYTFRINGQNYHRMGSLLPAEGVPSRYAQLYFFDMQNEIRNRMSAFISKETPETYLVDAFTAIEEQWLNWTRNNQDILRVDLYHNLCDYVTRGDTSATGLGKRIVLPQTYIGSPRYMMYNYQDVMALCQTYGNPDLFITFTSNLKWPEIAEMLAYIPGQKSHDRPEVGTRVFKMNLRDLLEDLTRHHIFGKSCAGRLIKDIISAELPCLTNDPDAYKVVSEFMLHGPRRAETKHTPCTKEGKCSKHFPKKFLAETIINKDGYPVYHRKNNEITAVKGNFTYNNKHVVPHNRYPLLKYHAHINVEWCNSSKAIKYLFNYLNKGPDRATIAIQENVKAGAKGASDHIMVVDEIKNYLNCRYPDLNLSDEQVRNYCLLEIQDLLNTHGKSLTDFKDLPQPNPKLLTNLDNLLLREALSFNANKSKMIILLHPWTKRYRENFLIQDHNRKIKIRTNDCACCRIFK
ncbi:DNA helicase PIF1, ATP-dependent [Tanacetum coccineum]|uniref:DNA helicase PIF1, ATP-dependent n=1 Tax=Tanacetum coccineum TaxID=301880 RepID=A0ABQ5J5I0_9ASTR